MAKTKQDDQTENLPAEINRPPVRFNSGKVQVDDFESLQRFAGMLSKSKMIPDAYKNNIPDCCVAIMEAMHLGLSPITYMRWSYVVHGKPGIESKLAIALCNRSGVFRGPIQFAFAGEGKQRECRAYAVHKRTGDECAASCSIKIAEAEGWYKQNPKWQNMPDLMLQYRAAMFLIRTYCPEVLLGAETVEEIIDTEPAAPPRQPAASLTALQQKLESELAGEPEAARDDEGEVVDEAGEVHQKSFAMQGEGNYAG